MDDNGWNEFSEDEYVEVLFMGLENKISEEEVEGVVDLEAELVSALEELGKYKRMYKISKTHMAEFAEKNNDAKRIIVDLKIQLQEAIKKENNLEQQLKKREQELEKFEVELILLKKKTNE